MKRALATLFAATAIGAAAPGLAQDGHVLPPPPPVTAYPEPDYTEQEYAQQEYAEPVYASAVPARPLQVIHHPAPVTYPAPTMYHPAPWPQGQYQQQVAAAQYHAAPGLPPHPSPGYTMEQRDAWLADCRAQYYGEGRKTGGIVGGLLGAIGGGIAGHEITGGSNTRQLGGTLIGAGVGGLAGLAIGAAIGAASDRNERIDECEAYLRSYAGGYLPGPGYAQGYGYYGYTTVMVPVQVQTAYSYSAPIRRENREVIEEVVEETVVVPQKTTKYVKAAAPAAKYAKGKAVRSAK